ncbi:SGNH/GDSL hydrolase family protein [Ornithinimicrobium panacihumi]|uniref:SGNH/GDSL hydrolase family protein n=1 Tax=Ornithinimicrobium panacihumi TaxID=2008449 RepID=UPI003F8A9CC5
MTRRRVSPVPLSITLSTALAGTVLAGLSGAAAAGAQPAPESRSVPAGSSYVALGDSFSSGTGTRASTDSTCYRSPYGYPQLLADAHGLELDYQACSGAVSADVHANQVQALSAGTDYVTMTIGGNDLGFASTITQCALPGWMSNCNGKIDEGLNTLRTQMAGRYDTLFADIASRAPSAEVVIGNYPRLFNGTDCNAGTFFSAAEMSRLNAAVDELSTLIEGRTAAAGFTFVDSRPAFMGHAVCDSPEWINGLSWPINESYHPNRAGNVGYADVFWPGTSGAGATAATTTSSTTAMRPATTAQQLRAEADVVLAMHLDSPANLDAAQEAGVSPGAVKRHVAQLRSGNPDVVRRGLDGLAALDRAHAAQD